MVYRAWKVRASGAFRRGRRSADGGNGLTPCLGLGDRRDERSIGLARAMTSGVRSRSAGMSFAGSRFVPWPARTEPGVGSGLGDRMPLARSRPASAARDEKSSSP